jgi:hypothetical protein
MDPYLEGHLWPDVHHALATKIRQLLVPLLAPRYVVRIEVSVIRDEEPDAEIGIMYPDVEVLRRRNSVLESSQIEPTTAAVLTPATVSVPALQAMEVKVASVVIKDAAHNRLVTSMEIISPVNKRRPGLSGYRRKRSELMRAGIHLIEIDLLRRGTRPLKSSRLPNSHYLIGLTRAGSGRTDLWQLSIRDPLPVMPVPLTAPDHDVPIDLGVVMAAVYDEAQYALSIDYRQPPPPPVLMENDERWMRERILQTGKL